jgi:uncharacterized protein (TIGR01440 family)
MYEDIRIQAAAAITELLTIASLRKGSIVVIGCSSSEIVGEQIGKGSAPDAAKAVLEGVMPVMEGHDLFLAAQCCEHLNRALIIEREAMEKFGFEQVSVRPRPKAGGSFATAAYEYMKDPVAVEHVRASAGLDIAVHSSGCTSKTWLFRSAER